MKVLYFDVIGGASGDMILGALIDAGVPLESLKTLLGSLQLSEFDLRATQVSKNGFRATQVEVVITDQPPERHYQEIREIILQSSLPEEIQTKSLEIFHRIAEVEARIHNQPVEEVHLHELGGTDTIVDVTGTLCALHYLGIGKVYASPLPMGRGFVQGAHGEIPLPAPATVGLLAGVPVYGRDIAAELVTPTGAALLSSLAEEFGPPPPLTLAAVGYGAGRRDLPTPNLLRVFVGEAASSPDLKRLAVLETNLDDLNPEIISYVVSKLFEAGALDVSLHPIQMKKNRPGTLIQVLAEIRDTDLHRSILFRETSTLGIRQYLVDRYCLPRRIEKLATPYGTIHMKIADLGGGQLKASPEYEDCAAIASKHGIPLQQVYRLAIQLYSTTQDQ